ncbi:MAG: PH domain-containing protein [Clostridia bacterium]|nr:PH domain-containing protein [Clostridia bacterium]
MGFIKEKFFGQLDQPQIETTEQFLAGTDERIIFKTKPNKKAHIWESILKNIGFVLIWMAIDVAALVFSFVNNDIEWTFRIMILVFLALHMFPVWLWVAGIVRSVKQAQNAEYALTEKRIIIKSGKLAHDFRVIYYKDIVKIDMKRGRLDKMCGVADIYIRTNTESVALPNIAEVEEVWDRLARLVKQENPQVKI